MTCVNFDRARLATQLKSTQVGFSIVFVSMEARARIHRNAMNLRLLASPFGHPSRVCARKLAFPNLLWLAFRFDRLNLRKSEPDLPQKHVFRVSGATRLHQGFGARNDTYIAL